MQVSDIMSRNPITVYPETPVTEAQIIMKREKIHRLPVVDRHARMLGIVSEKDLLSVSPSAASTLDMYEMTALLAKIQVQNAMTKKVISVHEDTLVEDAARLLADNDIGGLPVVNRENVVIGMVTESDLFRLFIDMFGSRRKGLRLSFIVPQKQGELAEIASAIAGAGGNIMAFGTSPGSDPTNVQCIMKVEGIGRREAIDILSPIVEAVLDAREV